MRLLALCLLLPACTGLKPTVIYTGPQTPQAGTCDPPSRATLTRRGDGVILSPEDGTVTLAGTVTGAAVNAETTLAGVDKAPYRLVFAGQLLNHRISGTLSSQRCRYRLTLDRTDG